MIQTEVLKLKNGTEELAPFVNMTMITLRDLPPLALHDLVEKCRDRTYKFFSDNEEVVKSLGLLQPDGSIHDSIRNVVLSAAEGEGLDMSIGSPLLNQRHIQPQ